MVQLRLFGIALLALFLVACSSNDKKERPAELVDFEATAKLKKNWSVGIGDGQKKHKYTRFFPAVDKGVIFSSDAEGLVYAHDVETGKKIWKQNLDIEISGSLSASYGRVFVGTYGAELIALNSENGEELWRAKVSSEILAPPASNVNTVVVQTSDSRLHAFKADSGEALWTFDHVSPVLSLRTTSAPTIVASQVIAAFDNGQVISASLSDGSTLWKARVAQPKGRTELDRIVDIDGHPKVQGALVYAASYQGNLVAINRSKGSLVWKRPESTFQNIDVDSSGVYSVSDKSILTARSLVSGDVLWQNDQLKLRGVAAPAVFGNYVAVIDQKGYMHLVSKQDGQFAYRFKPSGDGFRSPMLVHQDSLITLSDDGRLTSYSLK